MSEIRQYGTTKEESLVEDNIKCHQIVKTIIQFGVTETQKLKIIEFLALELENRNYLQQISGLVVQILNNDTGSIVNE